MPTFDESNVHLVVESSKGAAAKLKFDTELQVFAFSRPLPLGVRFPFDWGFIPSTLGEDGDPLDGFLLHDTSLSPGIVVPCRLLGALCVDQTEKGVTKRNDRFVLRPEEAPRNEELTEVDELSARLRTEIEQFFLASVVGMGKKLEFIGWQDAAGALAAVRKGGAEFHKKSQS